MKILLTGGASGLGRAITILLAENTDHSIHFTYAHSADSAKEITDKYSNTIAIHCDFSNKVHLETLLTQIPQFSPDVLINNAITAPPARKHFHKCEPALFESNFSKNIIPVITITQSCIELFRKKKAGKIINILTSYVEEYPIGMSEYVASKAYIHALSNIWAKENAGFNITSNCISPSMMSTGLVQHLDKRLIESVISNEPLKRLITIEEVAETVKFLVSASSFLNGENIILNGGK